MNYHDCFANKKQMGGLRSYICSIYYLSRVNNLNE